MAVDGFEFWRAGSPAVGLAGKADTTGFDYWHGGAPASLLDAGETDDPVIVAAPVINTDAMRVTSSVWIADVYGFKWTDLGETSSLVVDGTVTMNVDQAIKMSSQITMIDPELIDPYTDYLSPVIRIEYADGRDPVEQQIGVFTTKIPPGDYRQESSIATFEGSDLTALAFESYLSDTFTMPAGFSPELYLLQLYAASGIGRYSVPTTGTTFTKDASRAPGTKRGDIINDIYQSLGYYTMHADLTGRVLSAGETKDLASIEPFLTITNDDIVSETLRIAPSDRQVYNVAVVTNSSAEAPLVATYRNDDPSSPSSTVNIGERVAPPEVVSGEPTQAALNKRARQIVNEGRSIYRTAELAILPNPYALIPHQTIQLDTTGRLEPFAGKWWIRQAQMGLRPENAVTRLTISQVTRFDGSIT